MLELGSIECTTIRILIGDSCGSVKLLLMLLCSSSFFVRFPHRLFLRRFCELLILHLLLLLVVVRASSSKDEQDEHDEQGDERNTPLRLLLGDLYANLGDLYAESGQT